MLGGIQPVIPQLDVTVKSMQPEKSIDNGDTQETCRGISGRYLCCHLSADLWKFC